MMASLLAGRTLVIAILLSSLAPSVQYRGFTACTGRPECLKHELLQQSDCTEVTSPSTRDCRWSSNLSPRADELILGGKIVAFQLKWFSGSWSRWFVPGLNDIDGKFNTGARRCSVPVGANTLRRAWSYFYDHTHKYIICKY